MKNKSVYGEARTKNPLYQTYHIMKRRCYDVNLPKYQSYGARGITVCDRWLGSTGFNHFCEDMGEKPTPKHSIDRIDVNGNYEPSNCKWSTIHEQCANRRNSCNTPGVRKHRDNRWRADIKVDGVLMLKYFKTEEEAIEYRKYLEKTYLNK